MKLFSYSVKDQWEFLIIDINLKRKKKKKQFHIKINAILYD